MFGRSHAAATGALGLEAPRCFGGNRLFEAILNSPSGVIFGVSQYSDSWDAVKLPDQKINLNIKEMLDELATIDNNLPPHRPDYPYISVGRESVDLIPANTSVRNPEWLKKGEFRCACVFIHKTRCNSPGVYRW